MATGAWTHGKIPPLQANFLGLLLTIQKIESEDGEEVDVEDITHSGSGGTQGCLAGLLRGDFSMTAFVDTSSGKKFYDGTTYNIRAGQVGTVTHYITATLFKQIVLMIVRVTERVAVAGGVRYTMTCRFNSEVNNPIVYPL